MPVQVAADCSIAYVVFPLDKLNYV
ncbi:unnamed protein product, partial [Vitis vinifera]|uniref:Uncharacterized protein n=1 Tax=Vitis vinifera TaxID=29760 RepID=D7SWH4_VITVI